MEAPKFTGKNPKTPKRLLQMLRCSYLFQIWLFSYCKKSFFHGALFWGRPVLMKDNAFCTILWNFQLSILCNLN